MTVDNTANSNTLVDYQIRVALSSSNFTFAHALSNGDDLRFVDNDGVTVLHHWFENYNAASQTAVIWVRVPSIPASSTYTIALYYGNSSAVPVQKINGTMIFGDDFKYQWVKYGGNPVIASGTYDSSICGDPTVLYDGSSTYHMYYSGNGNTMNHATSSDGLSWIKDLSNPMFGAGSSGAWDDLYCEKPCVVFDGVSTYYLFYMGTNNGNVTGLGYATSSSLNGPWTKYSGNPIIVADQSYEGTYVDCPNVILDGTTWKLWYSCNNTFTSSEPAYWAYATASSPSGTWTKYSGNPIASPPGGIVGWANGLGGTRIYKNLDGDQL